MDLTQVGNPMSRGAVQPQQQVQQQQVPIYGRALNIQTSDFDTNIQEAIVRDHFNGTTTAYDIQYARQLERQNAVQGQQPATPMPTGQETIQLSKAEHDQLIQAKQRYDAMTLAQELEQIFGGSSAGQQQAVQQQPQSIAGTQTQQPQQSDSILGSLFPDTQAPQEQQQPSQSQAPARQQDNSVQKELYATAVKSGVNPLEFIKFVNSISVEDLAAIYSQMNAPQQQQQNQQPVYQQQMAPVNLSEAPAPASVGVRSSYPFTGRRASEFD